MNIATDAQSIAIAALKALKDSPPSSSNDTAASSNTDSSTTTNSTATTTTTVNPEPTQDGDLYAILDSTPSDEPRPYVPKTHFQIQAIFNKNLKGTPLTEDSITDILTTTLAHHADRLSEVRDACVKPSTAAELLPVLFRRKLDTHQLFFAMGESIAHLHYLWYRGELRLHGPDTDGVRRFALPG